uniref:YscQ/HrcQ family type III secretion apparatus protein n=1 Tax=Yersinia frederiksenii TaxID=29484 RepID=UPI001F4BFECE|nr:YscQ/HrcQ family type III secretion apparatus protein [Yersinia frederiksenii]ULG19769.1 hypothetical protein 49p1_00051 [Yersinia frederiksenii]
MLRLKAIDMREHNITLAAKQWKDRGEIISLGYPDLKGKWVKISDRDNKWSGWISLYELIELTSSKLAGMALTEKTERLILNWLSLTERPFPMDIPELSFEMLVIGDVMQDHLLNNNLMLQIKAGGLSIWLEELNVHPKTESYNISYFQDIGWPIQFILGSTKVNLSVLKKIECGDILFIKNVNTQISCFNHYLFPYEWNDEFIMTNEIDSPEATTDIEPLYDMGQLPVQLEFVIHRCILKFDEIQKLYVNKIYPLPQGIEESIEIRINGSILGRGELLQFDGKLGVEITEWLQESQCDK